MTRNRLEWCILRTSGSKTLPLAASLTAAGYGVWTPSRTEKRRLPRCKDTVERTMPIMPTFVFARSQHLGELFRILSLPINPYHAFSVFRYYGRVPLLADSDIASLRAAEEKGRLAVAKQQRHLFSVGQDVRVAEGAAAGMSGIVEAGNGEYALVCFGGQFRMKIATFLLRSDAIKGDRPEQGTAALAACDE